MFYVEVDWAYGVNQLIVDWVDSNGIPEDRIRVVSETEIIILNNPK